MTTTLVPTRRFTSDMLTSLDEPVRRYFSHAISDGAALPDGVRMAMSGRIKVELWLPFTAEQTVDGRSFTWRAHVGRGPLTPLRVTDRYADAAGSTEGRLLGHVTLFHAHDANTARSAATRVRAPADADLQRCARRYPFEDGLGDRDISRSSGSAGWTATSGRSASLQPRSCDSWIWLRPNVRGIRSFTSKTAVAGDDRRRVVILRYVDDRPPDAGHRVARLDYPLRVETRASGRFLTVGPDPVCLSRLHAVGGPGLAARGSAPTMGGSGSTRT